MVYCRQSSASGRTEFISMENEPNIVNGPSAPAAPPHKAPLGLRGVALFELAKGILFVVLALGLLSLVHKDVEETAADIVRWLHLDPAWHYSKLFVEASAKLTDTRLRLLALFAAGLATIRGVEAYGLWHERAWAEWFAVISSGVYLPIEVHHFWKRPNVGGAIVFVVNIAIVIYLVRLLAENRRKKQAAKMDPQI